MMQTTLFNLPAGKIPVVLSASRMTDMPRYYPNELMEEVNKRFNKGIAVHTLVLWTKHPASLLKSPLMEFLTKIRESGIQLYIQLTISGMGGTTVGTSLSGTPLLLEPNAPTYSESLKLLPALVELVQNPKRIRLRIDPIVRLVDAAGKLYSNLPLLEPIAGEAASFGIRDISFSFLESGMHAKVDKRFQKAGFTLQPPTTMEREGMMEYALRVEQRTGVKIYACSVLGFQESSCIDAALLQSLHDKHLPTYAKQPLSRERCGCTHSIDLGGWPPKKCYTGCLYCYANPVIP